MVRLLHRCAKCAFVYTCLSAAAALSAEPDSPKLQEGKRNVPTETSPREEKASVSWDSPKLRAIEQILESKDLSNVPRDWYLRERRAILKEALKQQLTREQLHELAASFAATPVNPRQWKTFPTELIESLVALFADSGDREGLVTILSVRCPRWMYYGALIEDYLVRRKNLTDPILILADAYFKCQVPQVRHALAMAVRRAFTGHGVRGKDDPEFVKNAMKWYEENKTQLEANLSYSGNYHVGYSGTEDAEGNMNVEWRFEENPLFKWGKIWGHNTSFAE